MSKIAKILSREILDSRGFPTVEVKVILDSGYVGIASAPSGLSVGGFEAVEVRDGDPNRLAGFGVLKAVSNVSQIIAPELEGTEAESQTEIDQILLKLDGTEDKKNLGTNAMLPVSVGVAKAQAANLHLPLYRYLARLFVTEDKLAKIPTPLFNILNGGKHGAGNLEFQEFIVSPSQTAPYSAGLQVGVEIYYALKKILVYRNAIHSVGDEGGFAPNLYTNADALEVIVEAVNTTSYSFGRDVFLGLDCAANNFKVDSHYRIRDRSNPISSYDLLEYYRELITHYRILIIEDPFSEDAWDDWVEFTKTVGNEVFVVADDLVATNLKRLTEAVEKKAANALLAKPNQVGTITETWQAVAKAQNSGWKVIVSHRSGETLDTFIADFAVAVGADYVKFGAPARGERVVKYNRLLEIEQELGKTGTNG